MVLVSILTAAMLEFKVVWDVTHCSSVHISRRFEESVTFRNVSKYQNHNFTSQKTLTYGMFIL